MKKELNIVGNRKIFFSVSIALILIGILCNIFLGVQLDISFKGGTLLKYSFTGDIDEPKLDAFITDTLKKDVDTTLSTDGDVNLINVSLVEELSLDETTALTTALIAGAALDVTAKEPLPRPSKLLELENFLCTPHIAWYSEEAAQEMKRKVAEEAVRFATREKVLYPVNQI